MHVMGRVRSAVHSLRQELYKAGSHDVIGAASPHGMHGRQRFIGYNASSSSLEPCQSTSLRARSSTEHCQFISIPFNAQIRDCCLLQLLPLRLLGERPDAQAFRVGACCDAIFTNGMTSTMYPTFVSSAIGNMLT